MKTQTAYEVSIMRYDERARSNLLPIIFTFPPTVQHVSQAVQMAAKLVGLDEDYTKQLLQAIARGDVTYRLVQMFDQEASGPEKPRLL